MYDGDNTAPSKVTPKPNRPAPEWTPGTGRNKPTPVKANVSGEYTRSRRRASSTRGPNSINPARLSSFLADVTAPSAGLECGQLVGLLPREMRERSLRCPLDGLSSGSKRI